MKEKREDSQLLDNQLRRVGIVLGWMLVAAGAIVALYFFKGFIVAIVNIFAPFFAGAILAYVLDPAVSYFHKRLGLRRIWGLIICYSVILLMTAGFFAKVAPLVYRQAYSAYRDISQATPKVIRRLFDENKVRADEVSDYSVLLKEIQTKDPNPVSVYMRRRLGRERLDQLASLDADTTPSASVQRLLRETVNELILDLEFYDQSGLTTDSLNDAAREALTKREGASGMTRVNRAIIESHFADAIRLRDASEDSDSGQGLAARLGGLIQGNENSMDYLKSALPTTKKILDVTAQSVQGLFMRLWGGVNSIIALGVMLVFTVMISFYFVIDFNMFGYFVQVMVPIKHEERFFDVLGKIDQAVGGFLRGQFIVCLCVGAMVTTFLLFLGLHTPALGKYCVLIGMVAGFANIIPYLGPMLGFAPSALIVLFAGGGDVSWEYRLVGFLLVCLMSAIVQAVEGFILQPYVVGGASNLHPLVVMLALIVGAQFGLGGMIVAVPVAAMVRVVVKELWWDAKVRADKDEHAKEAAELTEEGAET